MGTYFLNLFIIITAVTSIRASNSPATLYLNQFAKTSPQDGCKIQIKRKDNQIEISLIDISGHSLNSFSFPDHKLHYSPEEGNKILPINDTVGNLKRVVYFHESEEGTILTAYLNQLNLKTKRGRLSQCSFPKV